jgi:hypothetical protein
VHVSLNGPSPTYCDVRDLVATRWKADVTRTSVSADFGSKADNHKLLPGFPIKALAADVPPVTAPRLQYCKIATVKGKPMQRAFGDKCSHCSTDLIAPEWSEHVSDRCIQNGWPCDACGRRFEVLVCLHASQFQDAF